MASKKPLFHGCARSEIKVLPSNWQSDKARTIIPWKIYYRFYDPATKGTKNWGKQIPLYGMNEYKDLAERQKITEALINQEKELLDEKGYNPISGQFMISTETVFEIHPDTPFIEALRQGLEKLDVVEDVKKDVGYIVNGTERAAKILFDSQIGLRYNVIPISKIESRHMKYILEQCGKLNKRWSNNRHNSYKAHLSMIFNELKELQAINGNPTLGVSTKKKLKKAKEILTPEELAKIDTLRNNHYNFWRYIRIFFRSGSRTTEMLSLKFEHVNIKKQEFRVTVKKDGHFREDIRLIGNDVLFLWKELMEEAKPGEYLFARSLKPGQKKIGKSNPCRYWTKYVSASEKNGGLGIDKNFYYLKSTHSDLIADKISLDHARVVNGHTNENTTRIYAVGENRRKQERVKNTNVWSPAGESSAASTVTACCPIVVDQILLKVSG